MTRILLVDDDEMVLNACARGLRITGYEITKVLSPNAALDLFKNGERFAAVVSDLEMPRMHGDELCREVQKIAPTPFIIQSGHGDVHKRADACGAAASFMKPVNPSDLRDALARLITKTAVG